jgi:hypothetical protein
MPRVFKLKKASVLKAEEAQEAPAPPLTKEAPKKVVRLKKAVTKPQVEEVSEAPKAPVAPVVPVAPVAPLAPVAPEAPKAPSAQKKAIILKKNLLPLPPVPPPTAHLTKTMEAFEAMREYYAALGQEPTQADIRWYLDELEVEKKELDAFWLENKVTKVVIDAICRGASLEEIMDVETAAMSGVVPRPMTEADLGPMPAYGTGEFWAWCAKRKKIRLEKEAAIIAAGGTVPVPKKRVPKAPKVPQA